MLGVARGVDQEQLNDRMLDQVGASGEGRAVAPGAMNVRLYLRQVAIIRILQRGSHPGKEAILKSYSDSLIDSPPALGRRPVSKSDESLSLN